jgi:hypothetical protein
MLTVTAHLTMPPSVCFAGGNYTTVIVENTQGEVCFIIFSIHLPKTYLCVRRASA